MNDNTDYGDNEVNREKKSKQKSDQEIIKLSMARFKLSQENEMGYRQEALDDMKFKAGEQWPDDIKHNRELDNRPCITINRIPTQIRQITNDQRQNRPAISVAPVDDAADQDTADVIKGLIRHIEQDSDADVAYDTAFDGCATHGRGYLRVITQYCNEMSFEQDIKIKRIRNPLSVFADPACQEADYSDARWYHVIDDMTKEEFEDAYPDSELISAGADWESIGASAPDWMQGDEIRVVEYFYVEHVAETICLLVNEENGSKQTVLKKDITNKAGKFELEPGFEVAKERKTMIPKVKWCKHNCHEILERRDWSGRWIPIIPVLGEEHDIDGKVILEGVVRHAKDPQRAYNYWTSAETETIALAPRAPFIGVEGQFEGHEKDWKNANVRNIPYLQYKSVDLNGQAAPSPQRNVYEPPIQAITSARMLASEDIKATTGIFDAAVGNRSNETSGIAIRNRAAQAQTSNFHYIDNLTRSIRHVGRILIDLIPIIYDTPRAIRTLGEDMEQKIVNVNNYLDGEDDQAIRFDVGKYDVSVTTGPSYATKRQEAAEAIIDLTKAYPQIMEVAGDLLLGNMDWHGAKDISERLRKSLPANLQETDEEKKEIPQEIQGQIQEMQGMIEQLSGALTEAHGELKTERQKLESQERIAYAKLQVELMTEAAKLDSAESKAAFMLEIKELQGRQGLVGYNRPIEEPQSPMNQQGGAAPQPGPQPTMEQ